VVLIGAFYAPLLCMLFVICFFFPCDGVSTLTAPLLHCIVYFCLQSAVFVGYFGRMMGSFFSAVMSIILVEFVPRCYLVTLVARMPVCSAWELRAFCKLFYCNKSVTQISRV
jgi:hypothetical protein